MNVILLVELLKKNKIYHEVEAWRSEELTEPPIISYVLGTHGQTDGHTYMYIPSLKKMFLLNHWLKHIYDI